MHRTWNKRVDELHALLKGVSFRDRKGHTLVPREGFAGWRSATVSIRKRRATIFLIGNGASASIASHYAADLAKNAHLHTEVFSDLSLITAISNDVGYAEVFAEPLRRRGRPGDMLVAISSSGRSPNILKAADVARALRMRIVTLSAMAARNSLRTKGDLNVYVAASDYGSAESCHAAILHHWMDSVEVHGPRRRRRWRR